MCRYRVKLSIPWSFGRFGGAFVAWSAPIKRSTGWWVPLHRVRGPETLTSLRLRLRPNAVSARITDRTPGHDYVVSVWAVNEFGEEGARSTMLVEGTESRGFVSRPNRRA